MGTSTNPADGRNPAPPAMYETLLKAGYSPYQLVQDFFHLLRLFVLHTPFPFNGPVFRELLLRACSNSSSIYTIQSLKAHQIFKKGPLHFQTISVNTETIPQHPAFTYYLGIFFLVLRSELRAVWG